MPIQNKRKDVVEQRSQPHPILSGDLGKATKKQNPKEDKSARTLI